jgi:hypothetical protein
MSVSVEEVDSLVARAKLRIARERAAIRECVTTRQLARLLAISIQGVRQNFQDCMLTAGTTGRPCLFSRAKVAEKLSALCGRPVGFPTEPLLTAVEASAVLERLGVRLSPDTLAWYRTQQPHLSPPAIIVGYRTRRYARAELEAFAAYRREHCVSQGVRRIADQQLRETYDYDV